MRPARPENMVARSASSMPRAWSVFACTFTFTPRLVKHFREVPSGIGLRGPRLIQFVRGKVHGSVEFVASGSERWRASLS